MSLIAFGLLPFRWLSVKFIISFSEIFDRVLPVIFQSIKSRVDQIVKHSHKSNVGLGLSVAPSDHVTYSRDHQLRCLQSDLLY